MVSSVKIKGRMQMQWKIFYENDLNKYFLKFTFIVTEFIMYYMFLTCWYI